MDPKDWQWLEDALSDDNMRYQPFVNGRDERIFDGDDDNDFLFDYLIDAPIAHEREDWRDADELEED